MLLNSSSSGSCMICLTHLQDNPCPGLEDSSGAARLLPWGTSLSTVTSYPRLLDHLSQEKAEHPVNPNQTRMHLMWLHPYSGLWQWKGGTYLWIDFASLPLLAQQRELGHLGLEQAACAGSKVKGTGRLCSSTFLRQDKRHTKHNSGAMLLLEIPWNYLPLMMQIFFLSIAHL